MCTQPFLKAATRHVVGFPKSKRRLGDGNERVPCRWKWWQSIERSSPPWSEWCSTQRPRHRAPLKAAEWRRSTRRSTTAGPDSPNHFSCQPNCHAVYSSQFDRFLIWMPRGPKSISVTHSSYSWYLFRIISLDPYEIWNPSGFCVVYGCALDG